MDADDSAVQRQGFVQANRHQLIRWAIAVGLKSCMHAMHVAADTRPISSHETQVRTVQTCAGTLHTYKHTSAFFHSALSLLMADRARPVRRCRSKCGHHASPSAALSLPFLCWALLPPVSTAVSSSLLSALSDSTSGGSRAKSASSHAVKAGPQQDRIFSPAAAAAAAYCGLLRSLRILAVSASALWLRGLTCNAHAEHRRQQGGAATTCKSV